MRFRLATLALSVAFLLSVPTAALATQSPSMGKTGRIPPNRILFLTQGSPMARVLSMSSLPLHFHATAGQAVLAAEATQTMKALHRRVHPLQILPLVLRGTNPYWVIYFTYGRKIEADAHVSRFGKVLSVWTGPSAIAPYAQGGDAWEISNWMVLVPSALLFMLPFLDPRRLRRMSTLDGLAVLGFLVSFVLLAAGHLVPAVWAVYPPLIYLMVRLLRVGFGSARGGGRLAPLLTTRTLIIGLPLILGARLALSFVAHQEIDVGFQSVAGAFRVLHHAPIYHNDPMHGDTYGPVTYLAYVPFEMIWPWRAGLSSLHAGDAAAIFFDLATMVALFFLGRRLAPRAERTRLGLVLVWGWAACPFTTIAVIMHTNDALVALLSVLTLLVINSPAMSGAMLGLAAAAKFSPGGLLPLLAAPRQRGWKGASVCVVAFLVVVGLAIYSWLPPQGFGYFWQRTIHFQMTRPDVFSPWALHPTLRPIQTVLEAVALLIAGAVAFVPRRRSLAQVCALAGAVTIAIQLPATHWYYYYILWFLPFTLVAFVVRPGMVTEPVAEEARREWAIHPPEREPVAVGA